MSDWYDLQDEALMDLVHADELREADELVDLYGLDAVEMVPNVVFGEEWDDVGPNESLQYKVEQRIHERRAELVVREFLGRIRGQCAPLRRNRLLSGGRPRRARARGRSRASSSSSRGDPDLGDEPPPSSDTRPAAGVLPRAVA
jgi:hypothetical protein